jgi:hypothetical protein
MSLVGNTRSQLAEQLVRSLSYVTLREKQPESK